ncbi:hypothetical protein KJ996_05925, partial [Patescibacteria group bacterium]|nr:hypothetical protein [Patescibacteria group bacterium]
NEKVLRALEQERAAVQGTAATICNWPVGALKVTRSPIQQCANQTIRLISGTLVGAGWGLVQGVIDPFRKAA